MSKITKYFFAIMCVVTLSFASLGFTASATEMQQDDILMAEEIISEALEDDPIVLTYTEIPLYLDEDYLGSGLKIDETTYVPLLAFCEILLGESLEVSWDGETGNVSLTGEGIEITQMIDDNYMTANGRCLYLPNGVFNVNGTIIVPIREVCKIFGFEVVWFDEHWTILIEDSSQEPLESGDTFYDEQDLYWLSRVISSEAGNQPLEGMIGVGNVVMNRAMEENPAFPETIEGVIFQQGQFSVVDFGSIYMEPVPMAIVAAKLCLEGYDTVGDSLYFHNPVVSMSSWFKNNRTFVAAIEDHEFYA